MNQLDVQLLSVDYDESTVRVTHFLAKNSLYAMLRHLLSGWMVVIGLFYGGKWEPSMTQHLGCYMPFNLKNNNFSWWPSNRTVGFDSCRSCNTEEFILLRGAQCLCLNEEEARALRRIEEEYCDIRCDEGVNLFCGGNLGGNLYCHANTGVCSHFQDNLKQTEPIYRKFDPNDDFEMMDPCLGLACGRPKWNDTANQIYQEYMPNLNPEDCVIYCDFQNTSYAHIGWRWASETSSGN